MPSEYMPYLTNDFPLGIMANRSFFLQFGHLNNIKAARLYDRKGLFGSGYWGLQRPACSGAFRRPTLATRRGLPLRKRSGRGGRQPALGPAGAMVPGLPRAAGGGKQNQRPDRQRRRRYLGRGFRTPRPRRRTAGQSLSLPRRPNQRHDGKSLFHSSQGRNLPAHRAAIHAVQYALSTPCDEARQFAAFRRGRNTC